MNQATKDDLKDIIDFLADVLPFSALEEDEQLQLAKQLDIEYIPKRANKTVPIDECVYLIRTGAFEISDGQGQLVDRLGEGECFGISTVLHDNPEQLKVSAIEDSLVYLLPKENFLTLLETQKGIRLFFNKLVSYRTSHSKQSKSTNKLELQHTQPTRSLLQNKLVYCSIQNSIREAAEIMRENKVSCLLLIENHQLHGIVTDRDLRNRVVADALDVNLPVTRIATMKPVTISADSVIMEAQLLMSNVGVHHLPVMENNVPIGVVTASDIVRAHSVSMIHFVDRIFREKTADSVAELKHSIPNLLDNWIQADVSPQEIGESFAVIGDGFVRKAIALAIETHGEPPMEIAWLTFGSQARKEQSFASDQDNGLILEREPTPSETDYFQAFTNTVCALLDQFGYVLCPGDIMASNPKWRKTRPQWQAAFSHWVNKPEPEALLNASIFFDLRVVYGPSGWLDELKSHLTETLTKADLFFMHLTRNALRAKPPLGFFRSFILKDSGDHENELDIKHHGIALVNDLARIIALAEGILTPNTAERLLSTNEHLLQKPLKASLLEAWLLLNDLKLENQARQLKAGEQGSNFINPDELSPLRRAHLKNAFKSIERAQKALAQHYLRGAGV
jgi:CBS domain-containing protein